MFTEKLKMALIKRGDTYWLDIQIKGKRFRESLKTSNKKLAERLYSKRKYEIEKEILSVCEPLQVKEFFKECCELNMGKSYLLN